MHAMAGAEHGVMNHTVSGQAWRNLWFNGTLVGEAGINAALCGTWGCPGLLVTGDEATCAEGRELIGDGLATVPVKWGLSAVVPYDPGKPCEIRVELNTTSAADEYRRKPGVELVGSRELVCGADDWWTAWQRFFF